MLTKTQIFEIYQLKKEGISIRQIARRVNVSRTCVRNYLKEPDKVFVREPLESKLKPYYDQIQEMVKENPDLLSPVVFKRLKELGYQGKITILRDYLQKLRGSSKKRKAFVRFETEANEQMQIDWGIFDCIDYDGCKRKLYGLFIIEGYSRMLFVYFTHSMNQFCLQQALLEGFLFFNGTCKELVFDNMKTCVTERSGNLVRYNENFLNFLRPFGIKPVACHIRSPWEKGKVEKAVHYLRINFLPLRKFKDINEANLQVKEWLFGTANERVHQTTGEKPSERFKKLCLNPLPKNLPEVRELLTITVHSDFAVRFDGNIYSVPPYAVGKKVTVKADNSTVSIYNLDKLIATHSRYFGRKKRIELPAHLDLCKKINKKLWVCKEIAYFSSLGAIAPEYLELLSKNNLPIKNTVLKLLKLIETYDRASVFHAIKLAMDKKLYALPYIENLLFKEMTPVKKREDLVFNRPEIDQLELFPRNLEEYDAIILRSKKNE